jgi:hypothetical protein
MGIFGAVALAQLLWFRPKERAFREQIRRWHRYVEVNRGREGEIPETEKRGNGETGEGKPVSG